MVRTLEAALWAFASTGDFLTGALQAVMLGDDADTTGAVFGQVGGAAYGEASIPADGRERLAFCASIRTVATATYELAAR